MSHFVIGMWLRSITVPVVALKSLRRSGLPVAERWPIRSVETIALTAIRADRAVRPADRLKDRAGGVLVLEMRGGESVHGVLFAANIDAGLVVPGG